MAEFGRHKPCTAMVWLRVLALVIEPNMNMRTWGWSFRSRVRQRWPSLHAAITVSSTCTTIYDINILWHTYIGRSYIGHDHIVFFAAAAAEEMHDGTMVRLADDRWHASVQMPISMVCTRPYAYLSMQMPISMVCTRPHAYLCLLLSTLLCRGRSTHLPHTDTPR